MMTDLNGKVIIVTGAGVAESEERLHYSYQQKVHPL
ncbi:hypothetical protein SRABI133_04370 [Peribacillus simplex]|uniref:Uncharacterized protein n=1 Tax=Peribacillus simplex TaxID=1478 RepID=A0A9W4L4J6_9BACI|nr:hypothetical protein SRABI133_04370 [Peribacillus simplex]